MAITYILNLDIGKTYAWLNLKVNDERYRGSCSVALSASAATEIKVIIV
jgi:hypothetical protein